MIDWNGKFSRKAIRRLSRERVGWFITVGADGKPQPGRFGSCGIRGPF